MVWPWQNSRPTARQRVGYKEKDTEIKPRNTGVVPRNAEIMPTKPSP